MSTSQEGGPREVAQIFAPSPALRPLVQTFRVVEFPEVHDDVHLPNVGPVAAFTLRGGCQLDDTQWAPQAAFTGLTPALRQHAHRHRHSVLLVHFTPVGAAAWLGMPMEELGGGTRSLAQLLPPPALATVQAQLQEAKTHAQRVQHLEQFLAQGARGRRPDPQVSAATRWLQTGALEGVRLSEIAARLGLSLSALERRFRRVVGLAPKTFVRIVRMRHAMQRCLAGASLTMAAHEAGYFDQSHFINDVRRSTGRPPTRLLQALRR